MDDDVLYIDPLPETPVARPRKRSSKRPVSHATLGAAAGAEVVTGAFVESRHPLKGKLLLTCAAVGVGALYLGLLFYLYRKIQSLEQSLRDSLQDIKDLLEEQNLDLLDEPAPASAPRDPNPPAASTTLPNPPPTQQPPQPQQHPMDALAETLATFHIISTPHTDDAADDDGPDPDADPPEEDPPKIEELGSSYSAAAATTPARSRPPQRRGKRAPPAPVVDLDAM